MGILDDLTGSLRDKAGEASDAMQAGVAKAKALTLESGLATLEEAVEAIRNRPLAAYEVHVSLHVGPLAISVTIPGLPHP